MASNPRKFSEKIALHNQKQAEETAAFERIMHEVSETRYGQPRVRPSMSHHLHPHPPYMARSFLGGSLPNVNQMSVNPQMELQQHQHFEDSKHSMMSRHPGRLDSRPRPYDPRRVPGMDRSRGMNHFENPTGRFGASSYLPLPPENNWRSSLLKSRFNLSRTNSDSALHQSVMNPNNSPQDHFNPVAATVAANPVAQINPAARKDTFDPTNHGGYKTVLDNKNYERHLQGGNRPKSCEAPTINIVQSTDHPNVANNSTPDAVHITQTMGNGAIPSMSSSCLAPGLPHPSHMTSNTGSLPDLTSIQFPSPLLHPVDCDDSSSSSRHHQQMQHHHHHQHNMQQHGARSVSNATAPQPPPNAAAGMSPSVLPSYISNLTRPPLSPGKHRRHTHNGPSPLILDSPDHARRIKYPSVTSPKMSGGIKGELKSPPLGGNYSPYHYPSPHTTILSVHNTPPNIPRSSDTRPNQCSMVPPQSFPRTAPPMHVDSSASTTVLGATSPVFSTSQANRMPPHQSPLHHQQQQQRQSITSPLTSPTSPTQHGSPVSFSPVTSPPTQQQHVPSAAASQAASSGTGGNNSDFSTSSGAAAGTGSNPALSEAAAATYYRSDMTSCVALQPLQHQLEQFHVVNDSPQPSHQQQQQAPPPMYGSTSLSGLIEGSGMDGSSASAYDNYQGGGSIVNNNSSANVVAGSGKNDGTSGNYLTNMSKIPDITFTRVDDNQHFGGNRTGGGGLLGGGAMEIPDYMPGEELKVNMGLEGMHLLEDSSNMVINDPVVVDNFTLN